MEISNRLSRLNRLEIFGNDRDDHMETRLNSDLNIVLQIKGPKDLVVSTESRA